MNSLIFRFWHSSSNLITHCNGFTEGCHTKIKMLKRVSYGLRNVKVYWRKMVLGLDHLVAISTQLDKAAKALTARGGYATLTGYILRKLNRYMDSWVCMFAPRARHRGL